MYYECRVSDKHGNLVKIITPQQQLNKAAKKFRTMLCDHQRRMILTLEDTPMEEYSCKIPKIN